MAVTTKDKEKRNWVSLDVLKPRVCVVVRSIETEDEDIKRMKTLGICIGRQLEVVRSGDPLVVRVFGSRLGISASLGARVWLEICEKGHCSLLGKDIE
jgi:Fe2+ transport system protein FeoA